MGDNLFNPHFVNNLSRNTINVLPDPVRQYATTQLNTLPRLLTHILWAMGACNLFLVISSLSVSFLTFLASALLAIQTAVIYLIVHGHSPPFCPSDFALGVSLGISVGGTILSFFVCLAFGRIHAFCSHNAEACGWRAGSLNGVWWWSSCIFWLDLFTCLSLAKGHHEISRGSGAAQYQSIDAAAGNMNNASSQQGGSSFYQQVPSQSQSPATYPPQTGGGGMPSYNNSGMSAPHPTETAQMLPQSGQSTVSTITSPSMPSHPLDV